MGFFIVKESEIGYTVYMYKVFLLSFLLLYGCQSISVPETFTYKEIQTDSYKLASWQKITDKSSPVRIYIEGDGHAFNHYGQPTANPTPRGVFLRKIAFADPNPNVVYLARPCQYVDDERCNIKDWTTGRFSQKIVDSTGQAVKVISNNRPIVLIGYSGGALLSGLVIEQNPTLPVKKWLTLAGVLNHTKWTENLNLPPLSDSVDLKKLPSISQLHFVGDKDKIVSSEMTATIVPAKDLIIIPGATHDNGYDNYFKTDPATLYYF